MKDGDVFEFRVLIRRPEGASESMMRDYIKEAVSCWKGQFEADEPLINLRSSDVQVLRGRKVYDYT